MHECCLRTARSALAPLKLSYLHVVEDLASVEPAQRVARDMRRAFKGTFILNGGHDAATTYTEDADGYTEYPTHQ